MIDFFFAIVAAGMNAAGTTGEAEQAAVPEASAPTAVAEAPADPVQAETSTVTIAPGSVVIGQSTVIEGVPATPVPATQPASSGGAAFNMAVVPAGLVAEPQTPSGKFTTAAEVKPILNATKGNWVAVREYDGQDLLYVTHLWGWRCGLAAMAISLNDEPMQNWPLPPCHMKYATPNAILDDDGAPYLTLRLGSVERITIQIVYDDLSMDVATFERGSVLIP